MRGSYGFELADPLSREEPSITFRIPDTNMEKLCDALDVNDR